MTEASPPAYEDRFYSPVASGLFGFDSNKRPIGIIIGANLVLSGNTLNASGGGGGTATWGLIGGTLSAQTDLQSALNAKLTAASNLSDLTIPGAALTNLGGTTVGVNFFTLTNPSAITFPQINANNTVSALTASAFRTAIGAGTGAGTVTAVSVASANGFAGTSSGGATPSITITTTITGVLKGNGTAISAATSGTDYSSGTSALATGILKSTTTTGALTIGVAATDYVAPSAYASANGLTMATARLLGRTTAGTGAAEEITVSTGLTLSAGVLTASGSGGTVTSVSVATANGFAGTVATATTTPAITLTTTITGVLQGNGTAISAATTTGSGSVVLATAPTIAGGSITGLTTLAIRDTSAAFDVTLAATSSAALTAGRTLTIDVVNAARTIKLTGNPTLADWFDQIVKTTASPTFVTVTAALSGNATTATTLATARAIYGNNFDGSAALAQIIASTYGGTGNGFTKFTGPATTEKTFTLPNASATVLTDNAVVTVAQGGIGVGTLASNGVLYGNGTSAVLALAVNSSATNKFLTQSSSGAPAWATIVSGDVPNLGANPSASAGLTAVNGSATTYMRSDGAPAIDQSIAPTMTGLWIFGNTTQATSATTGSVVVSGGLSTAKDAWIGGAKLYVGNSPGVGNNGAEIRILGWNTANMNWQISTAVQSPSGLCITPSTAAGGTTFSNPEAQFIPTGLILGDAVDKGSNHDVQLQLLGWSSSFTNWQISTAVQSATGLCFTPSTAAGGTTFSSPVLNLFSSGIVQMTGYGAGAATFDASGNITSASDETLKANIVKSSYGLKELKLFSPIIYNWADHSGYDTKYRYGGWGAKSVLHHIPEAVGKNKNGTLSFSPFPVMGAMHNALIELDSRLTRIELAAEAPKA